MTTDRTRSLAALQYANPRQCLIRLRELERLLSGSDLPKKVRTLRTNELKGFREMREAALFCYFMSERIVAPILFSMTEAQDYDFVATWKTHAGRMFATVQIKELVPDYLNPRISLDQILGKINKYQSSPDLTVAVHLNQTARFDFASLSIPKLTVAALWAFGAISPRADCWRLYGNLLGDPQASDHHYPST